MIPVEQLISAIPSSLDWCVGLAPVLAMFTLLCVAAVGILHAAVVSSGAFRRRGARSRQPVVVPITGRSAGRANRPLAA